METLSKCPFCGASQTFFSFVLMLQFWKAGFYVECWRCGARGPAKVTKKRAADAWNYRAVPGGQGEKK